MNAGEPRPPGLTHQLSGLGSLRESLREEGAKGALIAFVSTVAFFGLAAYLVFTSETWPKVRAQYFSWEDAKEVWPAIRDGFRLDLKMFVIAEILILAFSLLIAVIRSLRGPAFFPLRLLAVIYIDLFRGIPLYLVIILLGFGVPALRISGVPNDPVFWGVTALILSYCAYTSEVYRAGIDSVHRSQTEAARSLGLTQWQTLRFAVLPQAVRNVVPALLNGLVSLQKDVALVGVLGVREAVREADIYKASTFNYTGFVVAAGLFLLISVPLARFTDWYTERDRTRRTRAAI